MGCKRIKIPRKKGKKRRNYRNNKEMKKRRTKALLLLYLGLQQSERTPDTRSGQIKIEKYKHVSNSTCIYTDVCNDS